MRRRYFHLVPFWPTLLLAATGCASRGGMEIVEARLRDAQDQNLQLAARMEQVQEELRIARTDADQLRSQLVGRGESVVLPEQADALFRARSLEINEMLTAGVDSDGEPGDEAITTVVTPVDATGRPVRLPGELIVVLTDEEGKTPYQRWAITPEESRGLWQRDLLAGGFRLQLPLESRPPTERVRISARLATADGRKLESSHAFALRFADEPATDDGTPGPVPLPLPDDDIGDFEADLVPVGAEEEASNAPAVEFAPPDGSDEANGNGLDRTKPTRTSDRFRFEDANIPRYN